MLGKYIKSKNKYILLFLLYLGIFCLIAYLYDMPIDACLYAMALCLFFAVVFMAYSYFRYKQKAEYLMDIKARIQYGPEQMPRLQMASRNSIRKSSSSFIRRRRKPSPKTTAACPI